MTGEEDRREWRRWRRERERERTKTEGAGHHYDGGPAMPKTPAMAAKVMVLRFARVSVDDDDV
ncbi:hypothetical protein Hdeb2414_s0001g00023241 [Helianthus debilis subsp. tardiflorus]